MKTKLAKLLLVSLLAVTPLLVAIVLLAVVQQTSLDKMGLDFTNASQDEINVFNDELFHWRQADNFRTVGFDSGYFTVNEKPAAFLRFYTWGPIPPILYGSFMRLTNSEYSGFIALNSIIYAVASFVFVAITRPNLKQLGLIIILLASFPSLILFFPSMMLEVINFSIAFIVAAFCWIVIRKDGELTWPQILLISISIFIMSLPRFSWTLFLIPMYMLIGKRKYPKFGLWIGFFIGLVIVYLSSLVFGYLGAPYSLSLGLLNSDFSTFLNNLQATSTLVLINFALFFAGDVTAWSIRAPILLILLVYTIPLYERLRGRGTSQSHEARVQTVFHLSGLGLMLIASILAVYVLAWKDIRVLSPHLLVSLLILVLSKQYRIVYFSIALFLVAFPFTLPRYQDWTDIHFPKEPSLDSYEASLLENGVVYTENAENPWCNTVFFFISYFAHPELLFSFEDGIAYSWFPDERFILPQVKSKYVMLPDDIRMPDTWHMQAIMPIPEGQLYLNLDADCD